jgi:hypothetical protein
MIVYIFEHVQRRWALNDRLGPGLGYSADRWGKGNGRKKLILALGQFVSGVFQRACCHQPRRGLPSRPWGETSQGGAKHLLTMGQRLFSAEHTSISPAQNHEGSGMVALRLAQALYLGYGSWWLAGASASVGLYLTVTLEKQPLNMIGNLV